MRWTREEYIEHMTFGNSDRAMLTELFGPLIGLEDEWRAQGATNDEIALTAFDFDYVPMASCGCNTGVFGGMKPKIIEDTPVHTISTDHLGRTVKLCKGKATLPLPLNYPVTDMDSWLKIKPLYEFCEERIDYEMLERAKKLQKTENHLVLAAIPGGFDELRELMGEENLCIAYYEEPELIEDILSTIADTSCKVIERVGDIVPIDNLIIHEDMAGKAGPLVGPKQVREFIAPYYKKVWDAAKAQGAVLFSQDSDGNMEAVMDEFIACGLQCFYPCEPAAGMDMVKLKAKYGKKIYFKGGIDKHVLRGSKEDIRRELEYKMSAPMLGGGTIFALDHRIPNGVSIDNYRYYVTLGREMLGLPPISGEGWERMAF